MVVPTVHLNGTSGQDLLDQNKEVAGYLRVGLTAMFEAAPNARDYYVQGGNAYREARREYVDRCERVKAVLAEVDAIIEKIEEQVEARRRK